MPTQLHGGVIVKSSRATRELGWEPKHDARDTVLELVDGLRRKAGVNTPPMAKGTGGFLRNREIRKGVGGSNP